MCSISASLRASKWMSYIRFMTSLPHGRGSQELEQWHSCSDSKYYTSSISILGCSPTKSLVMIHSPRRFDDKQAAIRAEMDSTGKSCTMVALRI